MCWTKVSRGREEWPYREAHTHNSLNRDTSAMNLYKMWLLETAFVERIGVFLCHTIIPLFQHLSCSKTQIGHYRKTPSIGSMIYDLWSIKSMFGCKYKSWQIYERKDFLQACAPLDQCTDASMFSQAWTTGNSNITLPSQMTDCSLVWRLTALILRKSLVLFRNRNHNK